MSKMELLGASEAENFTKQKWKQYCGTPCICTTWLMTRNNEGMTVFALHLVRLVLFYFPKLQNFCDLT